MLFRAEKCALGFSCVLVLVDFLMSLTRVSMRKTCIKISSVASNWHVHYEVNLMSITGKISEVNW